MTARLHVVAPQPIADPARWLWSGANPAEAPAPRVLCSEMTRRLALVNAAVRALRGMGIRVLGHSLAGEWPADGTPSIRIERDPGKPFAPFLDAAGPRAFHTRYRPGEVSTTGYAMLMDVMVMWEEPR